MVMRWILNDDFVLFDQMLLQIHDEKTLTFLEDKLNKARKKKRREKMDLRAVINVDSSTG